MTALFLALMLAAAPDVNTTRVEVAMFVPNPGVALAGDPAVVYGSRGVILIPQLRDEQMWELFDGHRGRFVTSVAVSLANGPTTVVLPLASGELRAVVPGWAAPTAKTAPVIDPSGVRLAINNATQTPGGAQLNVSLGLTQLDAQRSDASRNYTVFAQKHADFSPLLSYKGAYAVLLDTLDENEHRDTQRRQVGTQQIETSGQMVGVVLHLVAKGQPLQFDQVQPPIAPPGRIRVADSSGRQTTLSYREGMRLSDGLTAFGLAPGTTGRYLVTRLRADGNLDQQVLSYLPQPGKPGDFTFQDRDAVLLEVTRAGVAALPGAPAPPVMAPGSTPEGAPGAPPAPRGPLTTGPAAAGGEPGGVPTATSPSALGGGQYQQGPRPTAAALNVPVPLEQLALVAPAVSTASKAAVALKGQLRGGKTDRDVLLSGTLVSPQGQVLTAPGSLFKDLTDLRAQLSDGRELSVALVTLDASGTLALLQLGDAKQPLAGLPWLKPADKFPAAGTPVVVVGQPYGLTRTAIVTIVAGVRRSIPGAGLAELPLGAALSPGNSGGPVVDLQGRLVGIAYGTLSSDGTGTQLSMAVPADVLARFLAENTPATAPAK